MIVGIDLGTTNSLIASLAEDGPQLIPNALGAYLTPSAVGIDLDGALIVGQAAKELQVVHPERCASGFKRLMGTERLTKVADREFRPEELSSFVLRSLKIDAEAFFGGKVEEAVITVPAYFSDLQRKATVHAGEIAGLRVRRIINEPTAAAIAYGLHELKSERVAVVFDLGGGTFDVSVLDQFESTLEIRSSAGEIFLGGEDFTRCIASRILSSRKIAYEQAEARYPRMLSRLLHECEQAKRKLSEADMATVRFPTEEGILNDSCESVIVTSEQMRDWTGSLLSQTKTPLQRALSDAKLSRYQIDEVILVGGATRMPAVKAMLTDFFEREPRSTMNPDHVVALGAAIQAGLVNLDRAVTDMVVTDVAPFTLGIEVTKDVAGQLRGGYFFPVISRNTTIPISRVEKFSTAMANQPSVRIRLYQGESRRTEDNLLLSEFELKGFAMGPPGQELEIRFTYDLNGILEVEAVATASGNKATCVVTRYAQNMSEQQIKDALLKMEELKPDPREVQADRHMLRKADRLYRELPVDLRRELESLMSGFEEAQQLQDPSSIEIHRSLLESFLMRFDIDEQ